MEQTIVVRRPRTRHRPGLYLSALGLLPVLAGCAVGPDYKPPLAPRATRYTPEATLPPTTATNVPKGVAQRFIPGADIAADWWHLFGSKPLDDLVTQALAANPTLPAAQAALRQALENVAAQRGSYYPSASAELSAARNLATATTISPNSLPASPYYSLITPQLSVSFVPDVFGANMRAVESLAAQAESQGYALEASWVTLTSNVVAGAIQEASLRGQIVATQETIRVETNLLRILRQQQSLGQTAGADVATQEAALAQAQQALPPLQRQLAQQRDALAVLAGRPPSEDIPETFELDGFSLPETLPVSLPAALVAQRPDVKQAEATLHQASANIGQAVAARIPQITLAAQVGNSANNAGNLFTPGTNFWTLSAGVTQPIFSGFALWHKQKAAEAAFDQAAAQYTSTVLAAMQNVADALRALQADANAVRAAAASESAANRSLSIARRQLELGQVAYLSLLTAQNAYAQARLALVQAQAARLADTAALFQALGGGWWHRNEAKVASAGGA